MIIKWSVNNGFDKVHVHLFIIDENNVIFGDHCVQLVLKNMYEIWVITRIQVIKYLMTI
jgi:predicted DNA-binding protein with PD1-like motif